jgi:16S rRNA (uracil1498-N3)-methyltransferase
LSDVLSDYRDELNLVLDPLADKRFTELFKPSSLTMLIGPEGGLADSEVVMAKDAGYEAVQFGPRILRTETAAVAALAVSQTLWGDLG